ncbi:50S ribosomal protein L23, partial [Candidatus Saccharibacteria bacterium]|nr:50S ribosomal protein L23 [Candidatus Saccharibacteria bacterium]NIV03731.1 50S ribosomal protein L23 [Calditrichia bacterium]NIV72032.1 50S ribosomal protein L23 [Calditrichia bacterium]NIV98865.1 50S ribosomal protein L23 [Candidatus Saccharibacteria bacterium]NIW79142.1 50S ribosomal protein L23 [Calditrichia bacterium]
LMKRFSVSVKSIRIVNVKRKPRQRFTRAGRVSGFTSSYKKAIVTLAEGDTLDFLENV